MLQLTTAAEGSSEPGKHSSPRRKFTTDEDVRLRSLVDQIGTSHWESIASLMPNRTARQCRDRYKNYLLDTIVTAPWTPNEDDVIRAKYGELGPRWVEIAKLLSGRSGNHVKNRWHKHLRKKNPPLPLPLINEISGSSQQPIVQPPNIPSGVGQVFPQLAPAFNFPFRSPFFASWK
jgi:hypothetical protein